MSRETNFAFATEIEIAGHRFTGVITHAQSKSCIAANWTQKQDSSELNLSKLAKTFTFSELPSVDSLSLPLKSVDVGYIANKNKNNVVLFRAGLTPNPIAESITFRGELGDNSRYGVSLRMNQGGMSVNLAEIPILGKLLQSGDGITVKGFTAQYAKVKDNGRFSFEVDGSIVLFGSVIPLFSPSRELDSDDNGATNELAIPTLPIVTGLDSTDNNDNSDGVTWIDIDKTFGGFRLGRIGFSFGGKSGKLNICLDAGFSISLLSMDFYGLSIAVSLDNPLDFEFALKGLTVSFDTSLLSISGGLYNASGGNLVRYDGSLMLRIKTVTVSALASYAELTDNTGKKITSFFLYAALLMPLGGPPAFFINGLALGFGVNRRLILPNITDVPKYPLIAAATGGFSGSITKDLEKYIKVESGQNFITAGIKFDSFKIVNGFALLSVSFGNELEIGVLGIADVSVPPNVATGTNPIAKAQLALKAVFNMSEGVFLVEAQLTSESYILSKDCKLTGGFAAYFWFGNSDYSGDFVITLGGYHPAFRKPEHYPVVPRLGLNWNITKELNISGELYFALTPSTLMAGGKLSAVYSAGNLRAWFTAYADFLINWKPFSYDIRIGVSVGASYTLDLWLIKKTFSIELSADLHLWGPEIQGTARITWFIISFTISFSKGDDRSKASLTWEQFKNTFLIDSKQNLKGSSNSIIIIGIDGVIGKTNNDIDIINANSGSLTISSKIPNKGNIRPVNSISFTAPIDVDIIRVDGTKKEDVSKKFSKSTLTQNLPAAMWKAAPVDSAAKLREDSLVKNAVCGATFDIVKTKPELFPRTRYISLDELYKNNTLRFENSFSFEQEKPMKLSDADSIGEFSRIANSVAAMKRRKAFLQGYGIAEEAINSVNLELLAESAENLFSEAILIRRR